MYIINKKIFYIQNFILLFIYIYNIKFSFLVTYKTFKLVSSPNSLGTEVILLLNKFLQK